MAERLKRLDSIINKLKREKTMSLWTMQDLGVAALLFQSYMMYLHTRKSTKSLVSVINLLKSTITLHNPNNPVIEVYIMYINITVIR